MAGLRASAAKSPMLSETPSARAALTWLLALA